MGEAIDANQRSALQLAISQIGHRVQPDEVMSIIKRIMRNNADSDQDLPPPLDVLDQHRITQEVKGRLEKFFKRGRRVIPGLWDNLIYYAHSYASDTESDDKDDGEVRDTSDEECDLVDALLEQIAKNGLSLEHDVQVLTFSVLTAAKLSEKFGPGLQIHSLQTREDRLPPEESEFDSVGLTILLLDDVRRDDVNFSDDLYDAVIMGLELSRDGLVIVGPESLTKEEKIPPITQWKVLMKELVAVGMVHSSLRLFCPRHGAALRIHRAEEFQRLPSHGGCFVEGCHGNGFRPGNRRHWRDSPNTDIPTLKDFFKPHDSSLCDFTFDQCGHKCPKSALDCEESRYPHMLCELPCQKVCPTGEHRCRGEDPCFNEEGGECPPCSVPMEVQLPCCHVFFRPCCRPEASFAGYKCPEPCNKEIPFCYHRCRNACWEECGPCEVIIEKQLKRCSHLVEEPCHSEPRFSTKECPYDVESNVASACGHSKVFVPCRQNVTMTSLQVARLCVEPCTRDPSDEEACKHSCTGNCGECMNGIYHQLCPVPCNKPLICGHTCISCCSKSCPPCLNVCMNGCSHTQCRMPCGVPCSFDCKEPCDYSCPHQKCEKSCGEICDNDGCMESCPSTLPCGHGCVGYCGETCPEACRQCSSDKLYDVVEMTPDDPSKMYVMLSPCGHCVEGTGLETWLQHTQSRNEVSLKICPICRSPISLTYRRLSKYILPAWTLFQDVKTKIFGSEEELFKMTRRVKKRILEVTSRDDSPIVFGMFLPVVLHSLNDTFIENSKKAMRRTPTPPPRITRDKMTSMKWLCEAWASAERSVTLVKSTWRPSLFQKYRNFWRNWLKIACDYDWPLTLEAETSLKREWQRLKDCEMLYQLLASDRGDQRALRLANSTRGQRSFERAEQALQIYGPYKAAERNAFMKHFQEFCAMQKHTLNIPEDVKEEIIEAFGPQRGRWFKCPNGHVYVVTECGGVTEMGVCNECGAPVGGERHRIVDNNFLATEMDGAEEPAYPTFQAQ